MIISKLVLRNWRNFQSVAVDLQHRVFVVGPNASGKSNLLDSIRFLRDIARDGGGLQPALRSRGGLSKVRCLSARSEPDVEIDVSLAEASGVAPAWRYSIGITQQVRGKRQPLLRHEKIWRTARPKLVRYKTR